MFADPATLQLGKVFTTIALMGYIFNFSVLYSNYAIEALNTISVFNKRIDKIVLQTKEWGQQRDNESKVRHGKSSLKFDGVSAIWSVSEKEDVIKDISFEFNNNEKVALIGRVGCGKTTLLYSILQEVFITKGSIDICGSKVSYAEQQPVIVSGTVRTNITYGSEFVKELYDQVCEACQLVEDFK